MDRLPAPDITTEEAGQLCYMPNRDDYEREYDASAEQLVSNFALQTEEDLKDTDLDITTALKLAQVNIYTRRLRERARRKRLVRDYQLINNFYRGSAKRANQTRDERKFLSIFFSNSANTFYIFDLQANFGSDCALLHNFTRVLTMND